MISGKFIKSSFLVTLGNALPLLSGIVLLPFYINMLSQNLFAELAIYISITFLAQTFFGAGLESYILLVPIKFKDNTNTMNEGISTIFTFSLVLGIMLIGVSALSGQYCFDLTFDNNFSFFPFGFLSITTAFFNSYFKLHNNLLLSEQKIKLFFAGNVINFFATILISLTGLFLYRDTLWGPIIGRAASGVIIFLLSFIPFIKHYKFKLNSGFLKTALDYSFPMLLFFIFNWVMNYYDRIIIENNMPLSELAVYDFAHKCVLPLEFIQNGLFAAIAPIIYKIWKDKDLKKSTEEVNRYFNGYSAVFLLLVPLTVLFMPLLVPLVINKAVYYDSFLYIGLMAVGYCFKAYYLIYYSVILYFSRTKILPVVFLILSALQIGLMLLAAKYFGIFGIIISGLIIKIIQPIVLSFFTKGLFEFKFNKVKIILLPLLFLGLVITMYFFTEKTNLYLMALIQLGFSGILLYLVYKNELYFLARKYLKKN